MYMEIATPARIQATTGTIKSIGVKPFWILDAFASCEKSFVFRAGY
jgi:hypothetical protein